LAARLAVPTPPKLKWPTMVK
ncbi:SLBB domain protein, partial [Vibrio parahaemolyticus V-223/04]